MTYDIFLTLFYSCLLLYIISWNECLNFSIYWSIQPHMELSCPTIFVSMVTLTSLPNTLSHKVTIQKNVQVKKSYHLSPTILVHPVLLCTIHYICNDCPAGQTFYVSLTHYRAHKTTRLSSHQYGFMGQKLFFSAIFHKC